MSTKPNHDVVYQRVPKFLREIREAAGLTQRDLAAKIRRRQYFIARCETGSRRVDVAEFAEWCVACKIDPKVGLDEVIGCR